MAIQTQQQCYYPDGSRARNDRPCGNGTADSACCAPGQICLDNNYCLNVGIDPPFILARGSCTDQAWQSGKCPGKCKEFHRDGGCAIVLKYFNSKTRDSQYCCNSLVSGSGPGIAQCFQDEPEFVLGRSTIIPGRLLLENMTAASTTASESVPEPTGSGGDADAAQAECSSSPGGNSNSVTQVGLGVGLPLGVLAIAAILWALWERSQRQKMVMARPAAPLQADYGVVQDKPKEHATQELSVPPTELEGRGPRHELPYRNE